MMARTTSPRPYAGPSPRRGAARPAALLALAAALLGALAWIATRSADPDAGDADGPAIPGAPARAADSGLDAPSAEPAPLAPLPEARTEGDSPERQEPAAGPTFDVVAVDAATGDRVLKFWVKRDAFAEVAAQVERFHSDPNTGRATLARSQPPAPLSVLAPGYTMGQVMEPAPPGRSVEVRLDRQGSILGVVRDGASAPMPGARVWLEWYGPEESALTADGDPLEYDGARFVRTDRDGSYRFPALNPGVYATRVEVGGAVKRSDRVLVGRGEWIEVDHWLEQHAAVLARVLGPDGTPAHKSLVLLFAGGGDADDPPAARGYTRDDGRVTLGPLLPGSYRFVVVSDAGKAPMGQVQVSDNGPSEVDLEIQLTEK